MRTTFTLFVLFFAMLLSAQAETFVAVPLHVVYPANCPASLSCAIKLAGFDRHLSAYAYRKVGEDFVRIKTEKEAERLSARFAYLAESDIQRTHEEISKGFFVFIGQKTELAAKASTKPAAIKASVKPVRGTVAPKPVVPAPAATVIAPVTAPPPSKERATVEIRLGQLNGPTKIVQQPVETPEEIAKSKLVIVYHGNQKRSFDYGDLLPDYGPQPGGKPIPLSSKQRILVYVLPETPPSQNLRAGSPPK